MVETQEVAWIVSGIFALLAVGISTWHIYMHLTHYYNPSLQIWIVRILLMIPIYAIDSWFSAFFKDAAVYLSTIRDSYEAFVLYCFMMLLIGRLGGEENLSTTMNKRNSKVKLVMPLCCCSARADKRFLIQCKRGVLQFTIIKPFNAIVACILQVFGAYGEGDWDFARHGYPYLTIVDNVSITISMYYLILFYVAVKHDLGRFDFRTVTKFLCIKSIIFFSFWQAVTISVLVQLKVIQEVGDWTPEDVGSGLTNILICIEMFIFSLVHIYAFPHNPFKLEAEATNRPPPQMSLRNKISTLGAFRDVWDDVKQTWMRRDSHGNLIAPPPAAVAAPDLEGGVPKSEKSSLLDPQDASPLPAQTNSIQQQREIHRSTGAYFGFSREAGFPMKGPSSYMSTGMSVASPSEDEKATRKLRRKSRLTRKHGDRKEKAGLLSVPGEEESESSGEAEENSPLTPIVDEDACLPPIVSSQEQLALPQPNVASSVPAAGRPPTPLSQSTEPSASTPESPTVENPPPGTQHEDVDQS